MPRFYTRARLKARVSRPATTKAPATVPDRGSEMLEAPAWKHQLVGDVKVEVLHPSSSDGFRMTGEGEAGPCFLFIRENRVGLLRSK